VYLKGKHALNRDAAMADALRCPQCGLTAILGGPKVSFDSRPCPVAGYPLFCEHMVKLLNQALKASPGLGKVSSEKRD
jgi:hypothetical protein